MGNLWKWFRNSKLFQIHRPLTATAAIWKVSSAVAFDVITDLDLDLFVERDLFCLRYFRLSVKVKPTMAHYPLTPCTTGGVLYQNEAFFWPFFVGIHVSQFRYDNPLYLDFNSHLLLAYNWSHYLLSSPVLLPHFHSHSHRPPSLFFFPPRVIFLIPLKHHLHRPRLEPRSCFSLSLSTGSSPLLPCPARHCWNYQLQNSD